MIDELLHMIQNINDYHTPLGKAGAVIDVLGVIFLSFHIVGMGELINSIFTPLGVVLTSILVGLKIAFLCIDRYNDWKEKKDK